MTPTSPSNTAALAALLACAALATTSCRFEPKTPELRYSLNSKILASDDYESFAGDRVAQDQLRGLLELLVGTPSNPGFFLTEALIDDDFDPNKEGGDLSEADREAIAADNAVRFADALAAVAAGDFDAVRLPREALDKRAQLASDLKAIAEKRALLADARAGDEDADALQADLDAFIAEIQGYWTEDLRDYYPTLRESAEMYRTQCMHCHGVSGGGDGTTAPFLNPRPRDYRKGIFKFTSVADKAKPTRADLHRVLAEGIYTTAMPSFRRFSEAQLHGLIDYVRLLAIRGRVEELVALDYDPDEGGIPYGSVFEAYDDEWKDWRSAGEHVIAYDGTVPKATPEMLARGKTLYSDAATANCVSCHGTDFRGNGPSSKKEVAGEMVQITDDWGEDIYARDLTRGIYRFGRRPIDVFRRLHAGINGTPMPSQTTLVDPDGNRLLSDDDLWALVHYVRSIAAKPIPAGHDQREGAGH
jgi:mono/diheme cytochrome c family protein